MAISTIKQNSLDTSVQPVGVGQTWQLVTGSRAYGTTYTNSTGRPIMVAITNQSTSGAGSINITVGGVQIYDIAANAVFGSNYGAVTFIVPAGATYSATAAGNAALNKWAELR
jgi:hypothetical protein